MGVAACRRRASIGDGAASDPAPPRSFSPAQPERGRPPCVLPRDGGRFNWRVCNWDRKKYKKTKENDNYTAYVELLGKSLKEIEVD
jgi:hypothetical protein